MTRGVAFGALLALVACGTSCGDARDESGIEQSEFVATFLDLREATVRATLDSMRVDSILAAHGVTGAQLRAYIEARSDDPDALADTWREVLDSIAARDSAAAAAADTSSAQPDTI